MNNEKIVKFLINRSRKLEEELNPPIDFFRYLNEKQKIADKEELKEANTLLNDLKNYPHAFVLACIMDRQIKAEKAWLIPHKVSMELGGFEFLRLLSESSKIETFFEREKPHRLYKVMTKNFCAAIQKIHDDYEDNASNIWENNPKSGAIVRKFLEFEGVGPKIATMAANILVREYKIPMADRNCIDISSDAHVKRVFRRLGFIKNETDYELTYSARELNPQYPGIFDLSCWKIGRDWCRPKRPDCNNCDLNRYCSSSAGQRNY